MSGQGAVVTVFTIDNRVFNFALRLLATDKLQISISTCPRCVADMVLMVFFTDHEHVYRGKLRQKKDLLNL